MIGCSQLYREDLRAAVDGIVLPDGCTVMVTGATGLIGSVLTDALCEYGRGIRVIAVARGRERLEARYGAMPQVCCVAADVADDTCGLPCADYIIHAGANAHPMAFSTDPVGTMRANLLGTMNLLERLRVTGGRRLLLVSTGEVYGEDPTVRDGFRETDRGRVDTMDPRACYPESKRGAETLCAAYARQYGVDSCVARMCYVYGATVSRDNSRADAQFLRRAIAGEDIVLKSEGLQVRSYCYVTDAVRALLTILVSGSPGNAYNIADRNGTMSIRGYAQILAGIAGVRMRFELPLETERRGYSAVTRAVLDPSKLEQLGWCARVEPREGLRRTLRILRESELDIGQ